MNWTVKRRKTDGFTYWQIAAVNTDGTPFLATDGRPIRRDFLTKKQAENFVATDADVWARRHNPLWRY